jgi:hypothetical protein
MDSWEKRLSAGDEVGFVELYDAYADRLHHYLTLRLRSREDAGEVLQETFLRLARCRRQFARVADPVAGHSSRRSRRNGSSPRNRSVPDGAQRVAASRAAGGG